MTKKILLGLMMSLEENKNALKIKQSEKKCGAAARAAAISFDVLKLPTNQKANRKNGDFLPTFHLPQIRHWLYLQAITTRLPEPL